ncbi:helix-turn-helix domain-containing protein [Streptomyces sp. NPDC059917]|uniref:helix-turn-helix domain-containing protein n=1 Tax=Streptomyces sp. NPDC059917 TaxID=3347002 RepID=UPI003665DA31
MNTATLTSSTQESAQLGALIRAHRLRIGLTQRELADLSTISVRAIRDLEQGKARRPRTDTVRLMAEALRLGPRARTALEAAAQAGRGGGGRDALTEPPAPPTALHPLVGRDGEVAVLARELSSGAERLVNVVGLTGVGKTRLALEVAGRLHGEGMPVLWFAFPGRPTDYLPSADGELTVRVGAAVVELYDADPADGTRPGGAGPGAVGPGAVVSRAPLGADEGLAGLLGDRPALLVLDGAPPGAPGAERLTRLLRDCPGLRLLVTSEQPWEAPGERIFLLSPLVVPARDAAEPLVASSPAVRVFLDHVRRVRPEFVAGPAELERTAFLCRRLDGHPGALAAAASWLVVCDLAALCHALDADPVPLLDHLGGAAGGDAFHRLLRDRLARLAPGPRELLAALCARAGEDFELVDITALTGRNLSECGRMLRELLISGVVRAAHEGGSSRFRVLGIVRSARTAQAASAAFPTP